jgi:hypothetical protein
LASVQGQLFRALISFFLQRYQERFHQSAGRFLDSSGHFIGAGNLIHQGAGAFHLMRICFFKTGAESRSFWRKASRTVFLLRSLVDAF